MEVSIGEVTVLVKDIHEADRFYRDILDLKLTGEHEANRGTPGAFRAAHYQMGDVFLTLMAPTGPDSTILNRTLEKRGEGLHHYCSLVDEMDTVIKSDNPIKKVEPTKPGKPILPSLTAEQVNYLIEYVDNLRDKAIIALFTDSGIWLTELASIQTHDINWGNYTVTIWGKGNKQ